jgi:hypothetical protein
MDIWVFMPQNFGQSKSFIEGGSPSILMDIAHAQEQKISRHNNKTNLVFNFFNLDSFFRINRLD